ncbi:hypothetical protein KUTeg_004841 [Tegillarca granosa]|uniref:Homeodomain-only protein n=1 Tax=Tegillarca granosa TaxID=220873 RepID=A0ABQ9FK53_TEGGR|nr:hypothetical protein KUTeg_004841 [Tegillarca granosa]
MASKLSAHLTPSHLLPKIRVEQEKVLEANFQRNKNPNDLDVTLIAAEAGMLESDVQRWFQHRLACWRKEQGLPANSGTLRTFAFKIPSTSYDK